MRYYEADVAVLGAGPAGAHAAGILAATGLTTILVDRRPRGGAGAQWLNAVASWMFDEARVPQPGPDERFGEAGEPFIILPPAGGKPVVITDSDAPDLDMRSLGARLIARFEAEGTATALWETNATDVECDREGRPIALIARDLRTDEDLKVSARLFVDASGLSAFIRRKTKLDSLCPTPAPINLCGAAQGLYELVDRPGAERFLRERGGKAGEALSYVGIEGGYSLLRVTISPDFDHLTILAGSIIGAKVASGTSILNRFVESQPWVGPRRFGGARAIPLGRAYTHLVTPGLALLGDSACQVFSTHGSGIGIGLIAARILGDTVAAAHASRNDIGSLASLWPYACDFHRQWGGLLGSSDAFRRFSQRLVPHEGRDLFDSGILTASMLRDGLEQREMSIDSAELPMVALRAAMHPWLLGMLAPVLARMPIISTIARSYPMEPPTDTPVLDRYEAIMSVLVDGV